MKSNPLVTIVTVSYNSVKTIEETIKSIINQTYKNIEYIIIDGGSNDGTIEIINKYQNFISYYISEKDNGMYDALYKGFSKSSGDICAYLNSDDLYPIEAIEKVVAAFSKNPQVLWLKGLDVVFDSNSQITYMNMPPIIINDLLRKGAYIGCYNQWIQQETIFWRKQMNSTVNWEKFVEFKLAGDYFMWYCFSKKAKLYILPEFIGGFRRRSGQLSSNFKDYKQEAMSFLQKVSFTDKIRLWIYGKIFQHASNSFIYKQIFRKRIIN